jgi:hypothetical protein
VDLASEFRWGQIWFLPLATTRPTGGKSRSDIRTPGKSACIRYYARSTRLSDASHPSNPQNDHIDCMHLYPALQANICDIDRESMPSKQPKRDRSIRGLPLPIALEVQAEDHRTASQISDASHPSNPQDDRIDCMHLYPALQANICYIDRELMPSKQPKRDGFHSRSPSSYRAGGASRRSSYR